MKDAVYIRHVNLDLPTFHRLVEHEKKSGAELMVHQTTGCGRELRWGLGSVILRRDHAEKFAQECPSCTE